jgi:4-amino-4-deoxy-L-arabinose transferase-like glycosyltransferase
MRGRGWSRVALLAVLIFDVWWRCHTVGPTLRSWIGVNFYPVAGAQAEPLDCDEAIYAYMGKRITRGAVMYRDMTENKPPGGYWFYAAAVAIGGANELTVRLMPIPFVLATIVLVWWMALRMRGPACAVVAAMSYAVLSTDPFLFGNGANMEHMINLASTAALALLVSTWDSRGRWRALILAGACLGLAVLIKQVVLIQGLVCVAALLLRRGSLETEDGHGLGLHGRLREVAAFGIGCALVWAVSAMVLVVQGGWTPSIDDVYRYARASATDIPADPKAPSLVVRWLTGNADPSGELPWPFGSTSYLVWWGSGSWPFWVASLPALVWLACGPDSRGPRRLVAAWTLAAWVEVVLPRHFWQHYYLLPLPGMAVAVAVFLGDLIVDARARAGRRVLRVATAFGVSAALCATAVIQVNEYLRVPPEQLTIRDKGGRQWVALREIGREIGVRSQSLPHPTLFIWGWQSPLFFYSGLEPVTPQLFTDDLIKAYAGKDHPLIRPRVDRMMRDLRANPPTLIFTGYPPFPALRELLNDKYLPSQLARGLWVEKSHFGEFESAKSGARSGVGTGSISTSKVLPARLDRDLIAMAQVTHDLVPALRRRVQASISGHSLAVFRAVDQVD